MVRSLVHTCVLAVETQGEDWEATTRAYIVRQVTDKLPMQVQQFLLFENASGYAIFEVVESDGVALTKASLLASPLDLQTFSKVVKLKGFSVRVGPACVACNAIHGCTVYCIAALYIR
jgi:hypothetical protein